MKEFFSALDALIVQFLFEIKSLLIRLVSQKPLLEVKKFSEEKFNKFCNQINHYSPNLFKFLTDLGSVYSSNRDFILKAIRLYIYISALLYALTFVILGMVIIVDNKVLTWFAHAFWNAYYFWTLPFKKFRFLIKYVFIWPVKILELIWFLIKVLLNFFSIVMDLFRPNPPSECMRREEDEEESKTPNYNDYGKSPENGRRTNLSPTEWDLNCANNKVKKGIFWLSKLQEAKNVGNHLSHLLENDNQNESRACLNNFLEKSKEQLTQIDKTNWCPSNYERGKWNEEIDNKLYEQINKKKK